MIEIIRADIEILEYAPGIFHEIRKQDGMTAEQVIESLDLFANRSQAFNAGEASGASGSFFFFSHDSKFIIKTMSSSERSLFLEVLPDYFVHLKKHRLSLLARIYGIFTVKMEDIDEISLVLMANTAQVRHKAGIRHCFDLKGSMVNRK